MRILIVEDDALLASGVSETLKREGYMVDAVATAREADAALKVAPIDIVILDIGLPGEDGLSWLRRLRAHGGTHSVIVLTARDAVSDRVHGLTVGADDYLAKPFATEELVARVAALARRGRQMKSRRIDYGPLAVDLDRKRATLAGKPLELPQREHAILEFLFANVDSVVSKERIAAAIASFDEFMSANAIEVHVSRLRAKLEASGIRIRTVRGLGYLVEPWKDEKPSR